MDSDKKSTFAKRFEDKLLQKKEYSKKDLYSKVLDYIEMCAEKCKNKNKTFVKFNFYIIKSYLDDDEYIWTFGSYDISPHKRCYSGSLYNLSLFISDILLKIFNNECKTFDKYFAINSEVQRVEKKRFWFDKIYRDLYKKIEKIGESFIFSEDIIDSLFLFEENSIASENNIFNEYTLNKEFRTFGFILSWGDSDLSRDNKFVKTIRD